MLHNSHVDPTNILNKYYLYRDGPYFINCPIDNNVWLS